MKILIISPHTDDGELGAGGSISRFTREGNEIFHAVFSCCEESLPKTCHPDTLEKEFLAAQSVSGIKKENVFIYRNKVRHFPEVRREILESLVEIKKGIKPELVISPSINDYHQDHNVLAMECIRCFKNQSSILSYELPWNNLVSKKSCFVKLMKEDIEKKWNALTSYASQFELNRPYFSKEYTFAVAKMKGIECGSEYAESFEVIRWIIQTNGESDRHDA
jgi:LmbE family N-acetylglucosaminyl deacetylase